MKNTVKRILVLNILLISLFACAQSKKVKTTEDVALKEIPKKETTLKMNKDTLDAKVIADVEKEKIDRTAKLTKEAIATIGETESLLNVVAKGKKQDAIKKGKVLIGKLEVLLAKDPSLALLPVDVDYQKEEFVADIKVVRKTTKAAKEAMNKGYYRTASDLLKDLRSEMVINTYFMPTDTYPKAIKEAVVLLEEDKIKDAKLILQKVLGTVVIQKTILPLPVLNAEQMIIEAATIDAKDHENVDKVTNLLNNADYQLQLAEELGYGKKDKDYASLAESIKNLKKSVANKENSEGKFEKLKDNIKKFQNRLFPKNNK